MALIECKECNHKVSKEAESCPNCGAHVKKQQTQYGCGTLIVLGVVLYIMFQVFSANETFTGSGNTSSQNNTSSSINTSIQTPESPKPRWSHHISADEMTGERFAYAVSDSISPTQKMSFPYEDTTAWIGVGCGNKSEWAYIGFSNSPNLNDTETKDGYNLVRSRIKWDDEVGIEQLTQKWGADFIHFENDSSIIKKISESNSLLLELDWHGENGVYFNFPLTESSAEIQTIRELCRKFK